MEAASVSNSPSGADETAFDQSRWRFVMLVPSWLLFVWSVACIFGSADRYWPILVGLPAAWLLSRVAILIHEVGHAVAALLCGWRVVIFAVGSIGYHVHNREVAWIKAAKREEYAGYVLPVPGGPAVWTRLRDRMISLGGPLANLLTAAILFGLYLAPIDWPTGGRSDPRLFVFGAALLSLSIALGSTTDVQNILSRSRFLNEDWKRYRAFMMTRALLDYQVRLRDVPGWMVDEMRAEAADNGELEGAVNAVVVGIALDSLPRTVGVARSMLDDHRARFGDSVWLDDCDAYFSAIWEGDAKRARGLLRLTQRQGGEKALGYAAEASVLAREGERAMADVVLAKMRRAVRAESPFSNRTFIDIERQIVVVEEQVSPL